ncbi:C45 family peptidase [Ammoniphilus sp. CFH 90114]|uniref:C45 family autoproteolytic acyltransferase/hydolase n=1 Tax=Ammoniphilus sp. CFH 90114 TaxID=2493665 RepID=UPI0013E93EC5|nr:C45 family peptidase [Ammoniphilus sp. CFH 90114]
MRNYKGHFVTLHGSSAEIGKQQANTLKDIAQSDPTLLQSVLMPVPSISDTQLKETVTLLNDYCPGVTDEIHSFCEEMKVPPSQLIYMMSTYLTPGCSLGAVLPKKTKNAHTLVLRNYDLSPMLADFRLCDTQVVGKYHHIGFSASWFGRTEGINQEGLCVTFASCGMPTGNYPGMKKPAMKGLQFWAIVRSLLEQCKNVSEALALVNEMPTSSNMNLLIADASGQASLVETLDGSKVVRSAHVEEKGYLIATNHAHIPEIASLEQGRLKQSVQRYQVLNELLENQSEFMKGDLKEIMQLEYPKGLAVHNYDEFFGTIHSIVFDLNDRTLDLCFGSPVHNDWIQIKVGDPMPIREIDIQIQKQKYDDFWAIV